jgi:hypothetical protein
MPTKKWSLARLIFQFNHDAPRSVEAFVEDTRVLTVFARDVSLYFDDYNNNNNNNNNNTCNNTEDVWPLLPHEIDCLLKARLLMATPMRGSMEKTIADSPSIPEAVASCVHGWGREHSSVSTLDAKKNA